MLYSGTWLVAGICAFALAGPGITKEAAQRTALAAVHGGTVKAEQQIAEAGKPAYAFDINVNDKAFVERVTIDAASGKVIGSTYEGPQKM